MKSNDNFKLGNCSETETIAGARGGNYNEDGKGKACIQFITNDT